MLLAQPQGVKDFTGEIPTKPTCLSKMRMLDCKTQGIVETLFTFFRLYLLSTDVLVIGL